MADWFLSLPVWAKVVLGFAGAFYFSVNGWVTHIITIESSWRALPSPLRPPVFIAAAFFASAIIVGIIVGIAVMAAVSYARQAILPEQKPDDDFDRLQDEP